MATSIYDEQKLLIAIGRYGGSLIIEALGAAAVDEVAEYSAYPEDHFSGDELPKAPGFYVWEGRIVVDISDGGPEGGAGEADVEWQGEFRPATTEDLSEANERES